MSLRIGRLLEVDQRIADRWGSLKGRNTEEVSEQNCYELLYPICSMYGIFIYIWVIFSLNVGKYSLYGYVYLLNLTRRTCYLFRTCFDESVSYEMSTAQLALIDGPDGSERIERVRQKDTKG